MCYSHLYVSTLKSFKLTLFLLVEISNNLKVAFDPLVIFCCALVRKLPLRTAR